MGCYRHVLLEFCDPQQKRARPKRASPDLPREGRVGLLPDEWVEAWELPRRFVVLPHSDGDGGISGHPRRRGGWLPGCGHRGGFRPVSVRFSNGPGCGNPSRAQTYGVLPFIGPKRLTSLKKKPWDSLKTPGARTWCRLSSSTAAFRRCSTRSRRIVARADAKRFRRFCGLR